MCLPKQFFNHRLIKAFLFTTVKDDFRIQFRINFKICILLIVGHLMLEIEAMLSLWFLISLLILESDIWVIHLITFQYFV